MEKNEDEVRKVKIVQRMMTMKQENVCNHCAPFSTDANINDEMFLSPVFKKLSNSTNFLCKLKFVIKDNLFLKFSSDRLS